MVNDASWLLAQSDETYMNTDQVLFFRNALLLKQRELRERILEHESSMSVTERVSDSSDAGTIEEGRTLMMRILAGERVEALAVQAALERIAENEYGWCEETGEPIGLERLLKNPTAVRTTEAQTHFENRSKHLRASGL